MGTPESIPFTTAALLVVAAHGAGVTHGAAIAATKQPEPVEPEAQQPEPVDSDPFVLAYVWWGQSGLWMMTLDHGTLRPAPAGVDWVQIGTLFGARNADGSLSTWVNYTSAAGRLRYEA